jgi:hypothetical protein
MATEFKIKPYPELWWASLDMDVLRFDKARLMLGEAYAKTYLSPEELDRRPLRGPR